MSNGDILLTIWREAAGPDIVAAIDRIARLIGARLAFDTLCVRRLDLERTRLEVVAASGCRTDVIVPTHPCECTPPEFNDILLWCRTRQVLRGREAFGAIERLRPEGHAAEWVAAPLAQQGTVLGVVVLTLTRGRALGAEEERFIPMLCEPLASALAANERVHALERHQEAMEADNRALLSRLERDSVIDTIVGATGGLRRVMERVTQVAPTDAPVLILGETGTGKEVLARAIHSASRRKNGPVVRVNCGALPPGLIDSELFGHERGSFTGASNVRRGWFERADGGTLFLDEIGELPFDAQVRLLRILQDGTFERVGGQKPLRVDVRIVAATHRDLQDMVLAGTFREDLWYRISVFPIHLPAVRDRVEDIPALAAHFAWRTGKRLGGSPLTPTPGDVDLLVSYTWPGNVRELAAVIERAAILGNGRELKVAAALGVPGTTTRGIADRRSSGVEPPPSPGRVAPLDQVIARHIELALSATHGRIEGRRGAARQLAVNPHTLRARMRRLGIDWKRFRDEPPGHR